MAYISTAQVKEIRETLKKEFHEFKFQVNRDHYSGVNIHIMSGPLEFNYPDEQTYEGRKTINWWTIRDEKQAIKKAFLQWVMEIAERGTTYYETGDYGTQPSHYVYLYLGNINKPYQFKQK